jgi:hypothetical protein
MENEVLPYHNTSLSTFDKVELNGCDQYNGMHVERFEVDA